LPCEQRESVSREGGEREREGERERGREREREGERERSERTSSSLRILQS